MNTSTGRWLITGWMIRLQILKEAGFFCLTPHLYQSWSLPSPLYSMCQHLFSREYSGWNPKLTTHLHLVSKVRMHGAYLQSLIYILRMIHRITFNLSFPYLSSNININFSSFMFICKFSIRQIYMWHMLDTQTQTTDEKTKFQILTYLKLI